MSKGAIRLDRLLVDAGHFSTRAQAKAAITAGVVFVDDQRVDKAGALVLPDATVEVRAPENPYVSRGGLKLAGALDRFEIDPQGRICLDVGASTGGFTDCLLQRGAVKVYAVDVGYGQLAWKLRQDPRVEVFERTNFRHVEPHTFAGVDLVTVDVSFISLVKILPAVAGNVEPSVDVIALVKPQFEAGRKAVSRGSGVIRDPHLHLDVLQRTLDGALELGWAARGVVHSPITGPRGNIEFFVWWQRTSRTTNEPFEGRTSVEEVVRAAHQEHAK